MITRLLRAVILLALTFTMAACTLIPTTGPVIHVSQSPLPTGAPPVDVEPAPPVPGANPESILAGFLTAVASGSPSRFAIARQYLTTRAAEEWDPTQSVTIYSSDGSPPIVTDQSAVLKTTVIGRVDAEGHFTAVEEPDFTHNFVITKGVDGQWRIGDPGPGIFVSQYLFQKSFRAVAMNYFNREFDRLVTENLYINWASVTPTAAVQALLRGPSAWLSPAALTVIPAHTKLFVESVPVQDGVAQVSLTQPAAGLSEDQQVQMAAQILSTLRGVAPSITGVRIDVAGVPLAVPGEDEDGVVRADAISAYTTSVSPLSQDAYGLLPEGSVVRLPSSPAALPQPVPGGLGEPEPVWGDIPHSLAVDPAGNTLALATESSLWLASTRSGEPANKQFDDPGLIRPQIDAGGVWTIAHEEGVPKLWLVPNRGKVVNTPLPELEGADIVSFRVSPDRSRIALVARFEDAEVLGLLRISSMSPLAADGWRPLVVDTGRGTLDKCLDVGWASAMQLVVLASSTKDASPVVYRLDVDAALVTSLGPVGDDTPTGLAVQPRTDNPVIMVVTGSGEVLRYEDSTRWTPLASGLATIALPG